MLGTRPLRILVVDDDPAMVGAITALVGTEGHQVITAYDGLTAVKRFREERPDLVLLDLAMPGPDGFTVVGQMRAVGPSRSSSSRARAARRPRSRRSGSARTTTWSSRSASRSCWPGSPRSCAASTWPGPAAAAARATAAGRAGGRIADARARAPRGAGRRHRAGADADRVPAARGARPGRRRPRRRTTGWPAPAGRPSRIPTCSGSSRTSPACASKLEAVGGPRIVAVRGVGYRIEADEPAEAGEAPDGGPSRNRNDPGGGPRVVVVVVGGDPASPMVSSTARARWRRGLRPRRRRGNPGHRGRPSARSGPRTRDPRRAPGDSRTWSRSRGRWRCAPPRREPEGVEAGYVMCVLPFRVWMLGQVGPGIKPRCGDDAVAVW